MARPLFIADLAVSSPDIADGGRFPDRFTQYADNDTPTIVIDGIPEGSRARLAEHFEKHLTSGVHDEKVRALAAVARDIDVSLAQLAIGWCALNPDVSTVITGASRPQQVVENMGALAALDRIDAPTKERIDAIVGGPVRWY
jgi:aryl-alcohol dehydrogenase-like predicted oxidoreductase